MDSENKRAKFELPSDDSSESEGEAKSAPKGNERVRTRRGTSARAILQAAPQEQSSSSSIVGSSKSKPSILRKDSSHDSFKDDEPLEVPVKRDEETPEQDDDEGDGSHSIENAASKAFSAQTAQQRAQRLSRNIGIRSAPASRTGSPVKKPPTLDKPVIRSPPPSPPIEGNRQPQFDLTEIPLEKLETRRAYGIDDVSESDDDEKAGKPRRNMVRKKFHAAAQHLMKHHVERDPRNWFKFQSDEPLLRSGQTTPIAERDPHDYVAPPQQYREGVLGSLMKLYNEMEMGGPFPKFPSSPGQGQRRRSSSLDSDATTTNGTPTPSLLGSGDSSGSPSPGGTIRKPKPVKWYNNQKHHSTGSIADLVSSSTSLAQPGGSRPGTAIRPKRKPKALKDQAMDTVFGRKGSKPGEAIKIQVHLADTIQRKAYLLKICRALMAYGAPTHRLEEYMRMSARVLEIDSQFLYMPGCMIISFGDAAWHTTDVRIVRCAQAVNLSKLHDTHTIYKEVIHDMIGVDEAIGRLDQVNHRKDAFNKWFLVLVYGLASVCVGPFAFGARPIDLPIAFILGALLGFMQLILAPASELYSNIFEISAAVLTSFLARAFGSINGGSTFCFSALAQSSIALILPGYTVLCGSLELQSKNIVAGSVRMVYAIIYSLFLGFGITVGTSIYGAIDGHATSSTTCRTKWPFWWEVIFVLPFTLCLVIINQGKWKKMPPMLGLAIVGYLVNHYSAQRFSSNAQIAQTLGALAIGVIANLYSRLRHGLAAAALLPAIFVQVPSGLAASGSLISGVTSANQITNHTAPPGGGAGGGGVTAQAAQGLEVNSAVLNVGYSMIQIAIGITVGLFMSALVVYPLGKRRSGLFSF